MRWCSSADFFLRLRFLLQNIYVDSTGYFRRGDPSCLDKICPGRRPATARVSQGERRGMAQMPSSTSGWGPVPAQPMLGPDPLMLQQLAPQAHLHAPLAPAGPAFHPVLDTLGLSLMGLSLEQQQQAAEQALLQQQLELLLPPSSLHHLASLPSSLPAPLRPQSPKAVSSTGSFSSPRTGPGSPASLPGDLRHLPMVSRHCDLFSCGSSLEI